ncbi:Peptidoglycan/xylan/chitin deacetylase, PgdA/CDA1 family [Devosia crocina]|uniref:Chitooligosaccharide deacetylase n=1 Tax=Devosia crocina TaxID=429728 RepID=A0A1I7NRK2_9HYPH|nr:polysaccharide deacetylase family protein [Devosia crocina]SFV37218.1 Peptidoglycan/xylan/chitin deacetylase, PgdA/CDA1 family [Devosia crocina]
MLDALAHRIANQLLKRLPGPQITVGTGTPIVSFTFDDVPDTALSAGARILEAHEARGTFYIAAGLLGREEADRRLIGAEGCRELARRGHEIGCHTFAHGNLRDLSRRELTRDLDRNREALAEIVPGPAPRNFAYPYNSAALRHRPALSQRFRSARGGVTGINRGPTDRTYLRSFPLQQPETSVGQLHAVIDELVRAPGWLIFFGHDLAETPTPYGCTPQSFEALVRHARDSGCTILTIDQALDRFAAAA